MNAFSFAKATALASCLVRQLSCLQVATAVKNYGAPCPQGWVFRGEGPTCEAMPSYTGPCAVLSTFPGESAGKRIMENACGFEWPQLSACEKDYEQPCPQLWHRLENGSCAASFSYTGRCDRVMSFARLSPDEKKLYERRCDMAWPCTPLCSPNYGASCPDGWGDSDDQASCLAGPQYTGPCLPNMSFRKMDKSMKQLMETHCLVSFPCVETCAMDYDRPCPEDWLFLSVEGSCLSPDQYKGNCQGKFQLSGKPPDEKRKFGLRCSAKWPCVAATASASITARSPPGRRPLVLKRRTNYDFIGGRPHKHSNVQKLNALKQQHLAAAPPRASWSRLATASSSDLHKTTETDEIEWKQDMPCWRPEH